jgi:hypothetical protein
VLNDILVDASAVKARPIINRDAPNMAVYVMNGNNENIDSINIPNPPSNSASPITNNLIPLDNVLITR